jgi:hypothetical protein
MKLNPFFDHAEIKGMTQHQLVTYCLNFAFNDGADVDVEKFTDVSEMMIFILAYAPTDKVYLMSTMDRVYVSEDITDLLAFIIGLNKRYYPNLITEDEIDEAHENDTALYHVQIDQDVNFHTYDSYEDAYSVALRMMETSELCYS